MMAHRTIDSGKVGQNVKRVDAREKVTGRAEFAGDIDVAGMLHGKVLRSPYPHARIAAVRTERAAQLPGVVAVLTGKDLQDIDPYYGHAVRDRPLVAIDRARFVGDHVAAVAAEDEHTAAEALDLLDVEYEELPSATTMDEALADGAVQIHDTDELRLGLFHGLADLKPEGNLCYVHSFSKGDVDAVLEGAEIVVEGEYLFPAVYQYAMEPHTTVARWEGDRATIWSNCQHPYLVRAELADMFGLPASRVRMIVPYLGGGFGSKSYTRMEPITLALARKAGRPVRIANRVDESMVTSRRHNMRCWMRTSAAGDGTLLGREVRIWLDTGAYADNGPRVVATAADAAPGPYRWQAYEVQANGVYTNRSPAGSYRAFGTTHLAWIGESQVDEIARRSGVGRLNIREQNLLRAGEEVRPGGKPLDADLVGDIQKVAEALDWRSDKAPDVGRGLAVGLLAAGAHPVSSAVVRMEADGTVTVLISTTELGQGARTVFSQIVAQELGVSIQKIKVPGADTQSSPYDRSTGASRSTTLAGTALQKAAQEVRQQILRAAADVLNVPEGALELQDGAAVAGEQRIEYPELFIQHFGLAGGEFIGRGVVGPAEGKGSYAEGPVFWEVCIGGAEVEVDRTTGRLRVRKLVSVADVGLAINPHLVKAQEMGATTQGLGNALFEEMIFENGQIVNSSLLDYHIPTTMDLPDHYSSIIVENEDGPGPFGAKGVGEGALAGVPAAIVNALGDLGLHVEELPLTPERVWKAVQKASEAAGESMEEGQ